MVLLVVEDNRPYGLLVDRFWREQEVTLRPVEEVCLCRRDSPAVRFWPMGESLFSWIRLPS